MTINPGAGSSARHIILLDPLRRTVLLSFSPTETTVAPSFKAGGKGISACKMSVSASLVSWSDVSETKEDIRPKANRPSSHDLLLIIFPNNFRLMGQFE